MFYVASQINYCGKNPFKIIFHKLFPTKRADKPTDDGYKQVTIRTYKGKCNVARVNKSLAPIHRRMIVPKSLKELGVVGFNSDGYIRGVLFNTAMYMIQSTGASPRELEVSVIDPNGAFVMRSRQLLENIGTVIIYTDRQDKYRAVSDDNLTLYGADFVIAPREHKQIQGEFVVSPTETPPCIYAGNERFELDEDSFTLATGFSRIVPDGISQADYAAALAIFGGQSRLMRIKSQTIRHQNEIIMVAMQGKSVDNTGIL